MFVMTKLCKKNILTTILILFKKISVYTFKRIILIPAHCLTEKCTQGTFDLTWLILL